MKLIEYPINELATISHPCSCGKVHKGMIDHIAIGKGALRKLPEFLEEQKLLDGSPLTKEDKLLIVSDVNTWKVAGETVFHMLEEEGYPVEHYIYPYEKMHTEEGHIKELNDHFPEGIKMMIAVGSGTMNDITRYISFHRHMPYYIIGTAPSMDGYASDVSPVIIDNLKRSLPGQCASGIIGDTDILATAPEKMIAAGVGDIMAKFLDINDWKLSHIINGEEYCEEVADLMLLSAQKTVQNIEGLKKRESKALQDLMEALVLSGIAMSYVNTSRPGSAAEHSMAHVMEMTSLLNGEYGELHGTCVGMATCIITRLYEKFLERPIDYEAAAKKAEAFDYDAWVKEIRRVFTSAADPIIKLYDKEKRNDPDNVKDRLKRIKEHESEILSVIRGTMDQAKLAEPCIRGLNGWTTAVPFGFTREHMKDITVYSKEQRDRYAAIQFLYEVGELDELLEEVLDEDYGK